MCAARFSNALSLYLKEGEAVELISPQNIESIRGAEDGFYLNQFEKNFKLFKSGTQLRGIIVGSLFIEAVNDTAYQASLEAIRRET